MDDDLETLTKLLINKEAKICSKCGLIKLIDQFYTMNRYYKNGVQKRQSSCKECQNKITKDRYQNKKYDYSEINRENYLKRTYNITIKEYDKMFDEQNGVCAVCQQPEKRIATRKLNKDDETTLSLAVHHCHKTNKLLALVCNDCNRGMGLLKDDPELLRRAALLNEGELKGCLVQNGNDQ